jgi:hypothetical protein
MVTSVQGLLVSVAARELSVSAVRIRQLMASRELGYVQTALGKLVIPEDLERLRREREAKLRGSERHAQR